MTRAALWALLAVASSSSVFGDDSAAELLLSAQSLTIKFERAEPDGTASVCDVSFTGDEIRTMEPVLAKATALKGDILPATAYSYSGEFRTDQHTFSIRIGVQKMATKPILFVLSDPKDPRSFRMYQLRDEDARVFWTCFHKALESRARNENPIVEVQR